MSPISQRSPSSYLTRGRGRSTRWAMFGPALVALGVVAALYVLSRSLADRVGTVVVYAAQDQVYSEPMLKEFQRQTGIRVRPVFDSEAVKTVGLANRLLAERDHAQCDVFWGNEELRTRLLAAQGVLRETNGWAPFGFRSRRLVVNTNLLALAQAPRSWAELTNATWRGRVALGYPLFGTTATHMLALRAHWGEAGWEAWCRALAANQPVLLDGNSVVVRTVGQGQAWIGMTDSDDVAAGQRNGYPLAELPLTEESLLVPNTVAVIRGAPHPAAAQRLFEYLQQPEVVRVLVDAHALEGVGFPAARQATLQPNWDRLLAEMEQGTTRLKEIFLR